MAWAGDLPRRRPGVVSLDQGRPISGSYQGVDGMGLFWSMNP
ncbi:MAG: Acyl-CoA thioester hydrolase/BAAT N-terminal region, partial [Streptosporangiaceae bacterium]|nr:Acyl-CoA thioester hydrolase/BAAT N-terminal region [Streptosporangiaceae bacterium]